MSSLSSGFTNEMAGGTSSPNANMNGKGDNSGIGMMATNAGNSCEKLKPPAKVSGAASFMPSQLFDFSNYGASGEKFVGMILSLRYKAMIFGQLIICIKLCCTFR